MESQDQDSQERQTLVTMEHQIAILQMFSTLCPCPLKSTVSASTVKFWAIDLLSKKNGKLRIRVSRKTLVTNGTPDCNTGIIEARRRVQDRYPREHQIAILELENPLRHTFSFLREHKYYYSYWDYTSFQDPKLIGELSTQPNSRITTRESTFLKWDLKEPVTIFDLNNPHDEHMTVLRKVFSVCVRERLFFPCNRENYWHCMRAQPTTFIFLRTHIGLWSSLSVSRVWGIR